MLIYGRGCGGELGFNLDLLAYLIDLSSETKLAELSIVDLVG